MVGWVGVAVSRMILSFRISSEMLVLQVGCEPTSNLVSNSDFIFMKSRRGFPSGCRIVSSLDSVVAVGVLVSDLGVVSSVFLSDVAAPGTI